MTESYRVDAAILPTCVRTGDILLVKGLWPIRVITGESIAHVALIITGVNAHTVWEYTIHGFKKSPLSDWLTAHKNTAVWWGRCPDEVNPALLKKSAQINGYHTYGWFELPLVWWNTAFGTHIPISGHVCSTYVQTCWQEAGWKGYTRNMDPGDFSLEVSQFHLITGT